MPEPPEKGQEILDLVSTTLNQDRRSGLSEMLRSVARAVDAYGCILWQETPLSRLDDHPPTGQFFVLAEWFEGTERCNLHDLPLESATGDAVLQRRPIKVGDALRDQRVDRSDPFLQRVGVHCFCSVPITFLNGERGALNAYRIVKKPFASREIAALKRIVKLLPSLYQTISDKVSYQLVLTVNKILQEAEGETPQSTSASGRFERITAKICREIASSLQALEVSIFLEDRLEQPGVYNCMATTWPKEEEFPKTSYRALEEEGLTGWTLSHREVVRIFDLANFKDEQDQIQRLYPELQWRDSLWIAFAVRRQLNIQQDQKLRPLSFLAVPVIFSDHLLGVIRCCTIKEGPFYFAEQEVKLLRLVAAQIGQAWSHWLSREEIEEENSALQRFVTSIGELNRFVQQQVTRERPDERGIFHRALEATSSVIQNAEITDVRLLDEESHELYFETTQGAAWDSGTVEEVRARRARRFPVLEEPPTGGAHVVRTGMVYVISDVLSSRYLNSETFPDTRRMIIAPIGIAGKIFGVLDIRGTGDREFSRHAVVFAEFLGQQLGLYHYLMKTIGQLQRLPRAQAQTFEDFTHQLKSPILQIHARVRTCLQLGASAGIDAEMQSHLLALRGLASKAKRVSQSLRLFADLARAQALMPQIKLLERDALVKMLIETTIDQRSTLPPSRALSLHIATESFDTLRRHFLAVDPDLLFQAVNNVLDNAVKYSYPRTTVRVEGGITGTGRFHISVTNTGLPITAAEVRLCTERAWRSESAQDVTGEGSGIGLWIVKHIMDAHGGELMVVPTTRENVTEVKLLFPMGRARKQESGR